MFCDEQEVIVASKVFKPVKHLLDYMEARSDHSPFLFRGQKAGYPISYGTARTYVKEAAKLAGKDPSRFSWHSHRVVTFLEEKRLKILQ